jgi:hypothetical protein
VEAVSRRSSSEDRAWHLDRRIPIAFIAAICLQTGGMIWFASALNERVSNLEKLTSASPAQDTRLTRVEVRMEQVQKDVSEIKDDVKGLVRKGRPE